MRFNTQRACEVANELLSDDGLQGISKVAIEVQAIQVIVTVYDDNGNEVAGIASEEGLDRFYETQTQ